MGQCSILIKFKAINVCVVIAGYTYFLVKSI